MRSVLSIFEWIHAIRVGAVTKTLIEFFATTPQIFAANLVGFEKPRQEEARRTKRFLEST